MAISIGLSTLRWVADGFKDVKMKIGAQSDADLVRIRAVREAIGPATNLFVDANGAFNARQAVSFAKKVANFDVRWFEEPVSSDDLNGLRRVRDRAPDAMEIAAGEYGYDSLYFRRMLEAEAVDVIQLDATRCKGFTCFLEGAAVAARMSDLSALRPFASHARWLRGATVPPR
jgi:L-alanine-DL-glutamate epimerase-like enolase superfamily enzyme